MTTDTKKSLRSAGAVLACLSAIGTGALMRDRVDLGPTAETHEPLLVASTKVPNDLPEAKFFEDIMQLLKQKYVEPITDEPKLADGAVRGMVASLGDPNSLYMDADQYRVYSSATQGKFEGVGVALVLATDKHKGKVQVGADPESDTDERALPKLMIAAVVPGSSADKAGLKAGDWAEFIDGHWLPNNEAFERFQALGDRVKKHEATTDEYLKVRKQLREAAEKNILAIKARDWLMMGTSGAVQSTWVRGDKRIEVSLQKGNWEMPGFQAKGDQIVLPFVKGSAENLRKALEGKSTATLDLRNNFEGDYEAMMDCLRVVAPDGKYGYLINYRGEQPSAFSVTSGAKEQYKLTLLVDRTTRGVAEIFARALAFGKLATLEGGELGGSPYVVRWSQLPSGAGYTLVTAEYRTAAPKGVIASVTGERKVARGEPK